MVRSSKAVRLYMWTISLTGAAMFAACAYSLMQRHAHVNELLIFSCLVLIAELIPTKIPATDLEMAMTMPLAINLFLSHNIDSAVVFASVPMLIASLIIQRKRPLRLLVTFSIFNAADFIISACCASLAYYVVGGETLSETGGTLSIGSIIVPLMAWTAVYNIINAVMGAIGSSLYNPQAWKVLLVKGLQYNSPNFLFSVPISILFVSLYISYGWMGIFLLILPCLAGRHASNLYAQAIDTYRDTITTLGSYMQHYHPYTRGHLERVAALADLLGREMKLPVQSLMYIRDAGLLHDIGKVGVDYAVLDKVGRLTDDDWAIVKQHPARGADILDQMNYLNRIVPWVRSHHERPDGSGYPDGLASGSIPLEAAVIAVADAFDAMTGGSGEGEARVYRKPLTIDEAMNQVRLGAGTQFDPQVVKAFIRIMARREAMNGS